MNAASLSPDDLDAIQARADAATEGPWFREYGDVVTAHPDPRDVEEGAEDPQNARVSRRAAHIDKRDRQGIADADFIAAACTDVPALLALVREQAIQLEGLRTDMQDAMAAAWDEGRLTGSGLSVVSALLRPNPYRAALTATEGAESLARVETEEFAHAEWCNYPHTSGPCRIVRRLSDSPQA